MVIVLLWFLATKNVAIVGLGVTYIQSTGEHAPTTIVGPSTRGDESKNRKPKPIFKPAAKPAPKHAPKGKHVLLFKMKRKVGKGFYSVPVDGH